MLAFAEDEKVAELLRQATAYKDKKDWDSALAVLAEAKTLMLVSPVAYPAETWCKYPLYLQQAGRFEQSMQEFQFLLNDLERRARRDARVDDPTVGPKRQKMSYFKTILRADKATIEAKMLLTQTRQKKLESRRGQETTAREETA